MMHDAILVFEILFGLYFLGLNVGYVGLNLFSAFAVMRYMQRQDLDHMPLTFLGLEPPISILAPAFNEAATVVDSLRSLLQLSYSEYEIIVINDGSTDEMLEILMAAFELVPIPDSADKRLETQAVRAIYGSILHPNLRLIDKENGGKADALNTGINMARYPLYCAVDADSILQRDSLQRVVQPFLDDPTTVASGATIRVANGCEVEGGFLVKTALPSHPLALFQIVEYLRAFLIGRLGWSPVNALLIVSGAFGVFDKERVIEVGGYSKDTIGEDMELVMRLHRHLLFEKIPYRITFVPDPVCWTEAPEDFETLRNQRIRWQQGLGECLVRHFGLLFHPKAGAVGWVALPFFIIFEWLGPLIEITAAVFLLFCFWVGDVSPRALVLFLFLSVALGTFLSMNALLLVEWSGPIYPRFRQLFVLFGVAFAENFGYRQLNGWWRLVGLFRYVTGKQGRGVWGVMRRNASWTKRPDPT